MMFLKKLFLIQFKNMRSIIFYLSILIFLLFSGSQANATHIRAGDLVIRKQGQNTLCITMTLYRDIVGVVGQPGTIILYNPDGTVWQRIENIPFVSIAQIPEKNTEVLRYETCISNAGAGRYCVAFEQDNRNDGVKNMSLSVETPFFIESCYESSPFLGNNSNPALTYPPLDEACVGQRYIHNPQAIDPEGDSLSYRLVNCKRAKNTSVQGYLTPDLLSEEQEDGTTPPIFSMNPKTGDVIWNAPAEAGEYNIAYEVLEWRRGFPNPIGIVNRDMQIIVEDCDNERPRVIIPRDTCIIATPLGTTLLDTIRATDPDKNYVQLTWSNRELIDLIEDKTFFTTFDTFAIQPPFGRAEGLFTFTVFCNDVRKEPYQFTFRAEDFPEYGHGIAPPNGDKDKRKNANDRTTHDTNGNSHLVDLQTWSVTVVAPAPDTLIAVADKLNSSITLNWNPYICSNAEKMIILRREGSLPFEPTACNPLPEGYEIVGEVPIGTTTFVDNDGGDGLRRGITYCYRIYAVFPLPKLGESLVSMEVCEMIPSIAPYLTNVSVDETSPSTGKITVKWTKPIDIDVNEFPRPHTYRLARAVGFNGNNQYRRFDTVFTEDQLEFQDTNLNTSDLVYNYRILFYSSGILVDSSATSSNVRLSATPQSSEITLTWQAETAWNNTTEKFPYHYIFRNNPVTSPTTFQLIDSVLVTSNGFEYSDVRSESNPIIPDSTYCYYVQTKGTYNNPKISEPLLNLSQRICSNLLDTLAPCPPLEFSVVLDGLGCENLNVLPCPTTFTNLLKWTPYIPKNDPECDSSVVSFNIYYSPRFAQSFSELTFLVNVTDTFYVHQNLTSIAGCYAITVLDKNDNESEPSNIVCLDNCPNYALPNVFTPNGDNINDVFQPLRCPRFVKSVETKIFNRWSEEVFSTTDLNINWDGKGKNGNELSEGVYFYVSIVTYIRLNEVDEKPFELKGTIHLMRGN
jgi:gliding motility-associated-like protein